MSSRLRLVAVSGSLNGSSRTTRLVAAAAEEVAARRSVDLTLVEVAAIGPSLGAFTREGLSGAGRAAVAAIEGADALIVGSPIYKGSYTGLFKHLFDFVDPSALAGKPVILTATGGGRRHALAIEHQLRPLFAFFSALALPTSVYASDEDFAGDILTDETTRARLRLAARELAALATPSTPELEQAA